MEIQYQGPLATSRVARIATQTLRKPQVWVAVGKAGHEPARLARSPKTVVAGKLSPR
jgi:hypothetical protein